MSKKRIKKKKSKLILVFLLIALILLIISLVFSFQLWNLFKKQKIQKVDIIDECSLFLGEILHQIRDLPDCENACRSECYILDKDFYEVEFQEFQGGCNTCMCSCK